MNKIYISKLSTKELLNKVLEIYNINREIIYNEYGKPYLKNNEIYFNLSNSHDYSVCVVANNEVGIDIEKITFKPNIIDKICTEHEKYLIKNEEDFTKIWTRKESYIKYLGIGISYGLKNVDTLILNNIQTYKYEDYYISVCSKYKEEASFKIV